LAANSFHWRWLQNNISRQPRYQTDSCFYWPLRPVLLSVVMCSCGSQTPFLIGIVFRKWRRRNHSWSCQCYCQQMQIDYKFGPDIQEPFTWFRHQKFSACVYAWQLWRFAKLSTRGMGDSESGENRCFGTRVSFNRTGSAIKTARWSRSSPACGLNYRMSEVARVASAIPRNNLLFVSERKTALPRRSCWICIAGRTLGARPYSCYHPLWLRPAYRQYWKITDVTVVDQRGIYSVKPERNSSKRLEWYFSWNSAKAWISHYISRIEGTSWHQLLGMNGVRAQVVADVALPYWTNSGELQPGSDGIYAVIQLA